MTWEEVEQKIIFWSSSEQWTFDPRFPPTEVPEPYRTEILNQLESWFNSSGTVRAAVEAVIERYGYLRIGHNDVGGWTIHQTADNAAYIIIDSNNSPQDFYLTPDGRWQGNLLTISVLHEIMHLGQLLSDPAHPADRAEYETLMNGATFGYQGEVIQEVNLALQELGLGEYQRSSYQAVLATGHDNFGEFQTGLSYTGGVLVTFSRIGFRGRDDNMDISARMDGANALMFGLDGNDTLVGNRGNDFLYGGDNDDILTGGGGNDQLWGGTLNEHGRADGTDTARYQSAPAGIIINVSGYGVPITVQDGQGGTDALQSIEIVEGSTHFDTLVLSDLTQTIAGDLDYIDLGSGTDTIDVSALSGAVTVDLANPQNQTITHGGAVLHLRNVEHVNGQYTLILGGAASSRVDGAADQVTVGGSLFTYAGFQTIQGSVGNDRMFGGDSGHYIAGSGTSYVEGSGGVVLESTSGDTYFSLSGGGTIISGAGNDYIEVTGTASVMIRFGVGSGHDMLAGYFSNDYLDWSTGSTNPTYASQDPYWPVDRMNDTIEFVNLMPADVELIWDYTEVGPWPELGNPTIQRWGEAAIRIISTGETLYLGTLFYDITDDGAGYWYDSEGLIVGGGLLELNADNVISGQIDLNIFRFADGVNRSFWEVFDLFNTPSTPLPPEAKAAENVLDGIGAGSGPGLVGGSSGTDNLTGSNSADDVLGGGGDDTLDGGGGNDILRGGAGADTLVGGAGDDDIDGGVGVDNIDYSACSTGVSVDLENGTATAAGLGSDRISSIEHVTGSSGDDTIIGDTRDNKLLGNAGADVLVGGAGWDIIDGGSDNDQIDGGDGWDTIVGAAGDDVLVGGSGADVFEVGPSDGVDVFDGGDDWDSIYATADYTVIGASNIINVEEIDAQDHVGVRIAGTANNDTLNLSNAYVYGIELIDAGAGDDVVLGSFEADIIAGSAGNDTLVGGAGIDTLTYAAAGSGVVVSLTSIPAQATGGGGIDTISEFENLVGSAFSDILAGSENNNQLTGGGGDDLIVAGAGNDTLDGGSGDDMLDGGDGVDTVSYASSSAGITLDLSHVVATDTVGAGIDTLTGIENIEGSAFADTLSGDSGNNWLEGGSGNDTIQGSAGDDYLVGGEGADTVSYESASGGVSVRLDGRTQDTVGAGIDTIREFENLIGSAFADTLAGDWNTGNTVDGGDGDDLIKGTGDDILIGGTGTDTVSYASAFGVIVNLGTGTAQNVSATWADALTGFENIVGSSDADTLTGNDGGNVISGGWGNDLIDGGAGDDTLDGGSGTDTVSYVSAVSGVVVSLSLSGAQDTGGAGADTIIDVERIIGSAFADSLVGHGGANTLDGGAGNDVLEGGAGTDILVGGLDLDTASYASASSAVTVNLGLTAAQNTIGAGTDTLNGIENLLGSGFNDTLTGDAAANSISGGAGNDTLQGGGGDDALDGGGGADTASYSLAAGAVIVNLSTTGAQNTGAAGTDTLIAMENLLGSNFNDVLTGDGAANTLNGGSGDDWLDGGAGNDVLAGGTGIDSASYAATSDAVTVSLALTTAQNTGGAGTDTLSTIENLVGTDFNDVLTGSTANNSIVGGAGNDRLDGGSGNDLLEGGSGDDTIIGNSGTDTVTYASSTAGVAVTLALATAQNTIGAGTDTITSVENLIGSDFADTLVGSTAANTITGGAGDDVINGAAGADILTGGAGNDVFVFDAASHTTVASADQILDLTSGDIIDLSAIDANSLAIGNQQFAFIGSDAFHGVAGELRYAQTDGIMTVYGDTNGDGTADFAIKLAGTNPLTADYFVL